VTRIGILLWLCAGAIALGVLVLNANRRNTYLAPVWYFAAILLGPVFLAFILPLWLGKWGERKPPQG
jgi:hypothetical protein